MYKPTTLITLAKAVCLCFTPVTMAFITLSCAQTGAPPKTQSSQDGLDTIFKDAEQLGKQAASVGNQWRDSKKFLDQAKKAAGEGKQDDAIALASKAKSQYELAIKQAEENEQNLNGTPFYDANATPEEDSKNMQGFFRDKFPSMPDSEFANGFYALDPVLRVNWEAIEEFPPYLPAIDEGEILWNTKFANGKSYADCLGEPGIAADYPRWDATAGEVQTLPLAINRCRESNGEKPLKYGKGEMVSLQAYMAFNSRGKPTNVIIPADDPRALAAYQQGKKFYFSRRGQLNMACYHCHFNNAGNKVRANVLGTALGQTTHWPSYRSKWGEMGSLHRRYKGCNEQVRAKAFELQSAEYRNLEYFHTFMSNGVPLNGPASRF